MPHHFVSFLFLFLGCGKEKYQGTYSVHYDWSSVAINGANSNGSFETTAKIGSGEEKGHLIIRLENNTVIPIRVAKKGEIALDCGTSKPHIGEFSSKSRFDDISYKSNMCPGGPLGIVTSYHAVGNKM